MKRTFWIDTDTASDDAVALIMAFMNPDIEVVGLSIVAGNVPLDMGVQNALYTAELCGATMPIYAGAAKPLTRELGTAQCQDLVKVASQRLHKQAQLPRTILLCTTRFGPPCPEVRSQRRLKALRLQCQGS